MKLSILIASLTVSEAVAGFNANYAGQCYVDVLERQIIINGSTKPIFQHLESSFSIANYVKHSMLTFIHMSYENKGVQCDAMGSPNSSAYEKCIQEKTRQNKLAEEFLYQIKVAITEMESRLECYEKTLRQFDFWFPITVFARAMIDLAIERMEHFKSLADLIVEDSRKTTQFTKAISTDKTELRSPLEKGSSSRSISKKQQRIHTTPQDLTVSYICSYGDVHYNDANGSGTQIGGEFDRGFFNGYIFTALNDFMGF